MNKKLLTASVLASFVMACSGPRVTQQPTAGSEQKTTPAESKPEPTAVKPKPQPAKEKPRAEAPINQLTAKEKAAGWKLMFDGSTTDGWHTYGSKTIGNSWKVANGNLYLDISGRQGGEKGGDIISDEEYGNFELQLDWKISKNGNSGICIFVNENKDKYKHMWYTGPEMQILDNDGHPDGKIPSHRTGDLYDMIKSASEPVKPVGEWNHVVIKSLNGKLDFYLNGVHIIDTRMWDDNWKALVAKSKFKGIPDFATYKSGRIGLQDHGNDVWYRNIKIRRL